MNKPIERLGKLVIVGGGTAGWMAAASLANHLRHSVTELTLVESSSIGNVGVGEATIPTIRRFYANLGMSDADVMRQTQATCKLVIKFTDWHQRGESFFHPFGLYGQKLKNTPFHHYWMKLRSLGEESDLSDYCLAIALAKSHKFTPPNPRPPSELSLFDWALHFDAGLFADVMRTFAEANGVTRIDAEVEQVVLRDDNGFIKELVLANGQTLPGDLFIDCSGFKALLIEQALHAGYEDWSEWLPCDRAVAVASDLSLPAAPYTESIAHQAGWRWRIPLQHRQGNGHVYSSRHISDDEAVAVLASHTRGDFLTDPKMFRFTPGRRRKAWSKNCIALGLSAGFLEPLESTSIALVETDLEKIKMLFPDANMHQSLADEFNEMTRLEYERVRDFIILHYKATARNDSDMWRDCRNMAVPDTLSNKIQLFKAHGHFVKYRWEIFQPTSWLALYDGNKIYPETYDPMVDNFSADYLQRSLKEMRQSIALAAQQAPEHQQFLNQLQAVPVN